MSATHTPATSPVIRSSSVRPAYIGCTTFSTLGRPLISCAFLYSPFVDFVRLPFLLRGNIVTGGMAFHVSWATIPRPNTCDMRKAVFSLSCTGTGVMACGPGSGPRPVYHASMASSLSMRYLCFSIMRASSAASPVGPRSFRTGCTARGNT